MTDSINLEGTKHIAQLSNLNLSNEELVKLTDMFSGTLDYIGLLTELDTSHIKGTSQVTGLENVFQTTNIGELTLEQDAALKNAGKVKDNKFVTKAVFNR